MIDFKQPVLTSIRSGAIWFGVVSGTLYGLAARLLASSNAFDSIFLVMSLAFIFVTPFVIGYLTIRPNQTSSLTYRIFAPWVPALLGCAIAIGAGLEGSICVILGLPIILLGASLGGLFAASRAAPPPVQTAAVLLLPFIFGAAEHQWRPAPRMHRVETSILIDAPPAMVWDEIVSVPDIRQEELPSALYTSLGFPRPISAVIDRPGLGAVRKARFAGGLLFLETVNEWEVGKRLGFRIVAQTESIPPTTLDQHVTIGGPYFDVFQGSYWLDSLRDGTTRLHLASDLRVSTTFNWYASLWADRIMRSIQETILMVEKKRAEKRAGAR
jgi:hypothetical protein